MIITFDPNAEIEQYLRIPRGFCIDINGTSYILCAVRSAGLAVWPWDEERARERDYPPVESARFYEWPEIESLHIN